MTRSQKKVHYIHLAILASAWTTIGYSQDEDLPPPDYDSPAIITNSSPSATGASTNATTAKPAEDDNVIKAPKDLEAPGVKTFSKSETQKTCAKYQGKLLSVYGEIYKIQNCVRHLVQEQENIFKFNRQGTPIVEVNATDVAAIPVGDHWENVSNKDRPCSAFNGKYITFSYTDIYYVENCVRKLVPDYETLLSHKKSTGKNSQEVLALTAREFYSVKQGRDISSVIDKEFSKQLEIAKNVDIIPIDEACKGVEGKFVTFYSRMYKIEKCKKREIDAETYTMKTRTGDLKLTELRPEQWVSMPDGQPFGEKKSESKPK